LKKVTKNPLFRKKAWQKLHWAFATFPKGYTYPTVPSAKTFFVQKSLAKKSTCLTALNRKVTSNPIVPSAKTFFVKKLRKKLHWAFATFPKGYTKPTVPSVRTLFII